MSATFDQRISQWVYDYNCCRPTGNYFDDVPCPECGHRCTARAAIYGPNYGPISRGRNWKDEMGICHRCRVCWSDYSGSCDLPYDETGPGDDLSGYRIVDLADYRESTPATEEQTS